MVIGRTLVPRDLRFAMHTHHDPASDKEEVPPGYTSSSRCVRLTMLKMVLWPNPWTWAGSLLTTALPVVGNIITSQLVPIVLLISIDVSCYSRLLALNCLDLLPNFY